jgi:hypothetical protein
MISARIILVNAIVTFRNRGVGQVGIIGRIIINFRGAKNRVFAGADFQEEGLGEMGIGFAVGRPYPIHL